VLFRSVKVISQTGIRPGVSRTIQASGAVAKLLREYGTNPKAFQDETSNISVPRVLRKLFEELGATYIKLGQFIASSPTLFPKEYILEFQSCLDNTPTVPYSEIRSIIQEDLGKPISFVFQFINPEPLASASIAQVHRARLKDGTDVVIKVRKPSVKDILTADLSFLYVTSKLIEFINPSLSRISLGDIVGDLRQSMLGELDFKSEASNLISFREFLEKNSITDATCPRPFPEYSSSRILTMEYLEGVPLVDLDGIRKYSSNPELTLITALRTWALSVTDHRFFHADVHAGNLLVLEDGRIGFIDFGIVGSLSPKVLTSIEDAVLYFAQENYIGVAEALCRMGATSNNVDIVRFGKDLQAIADRIKAIEPEVLVSSTQDGSSISARMSIDEQETTGLILDIVTVAEENGLRLPREFGLLLKQSLYFDRYLKLLAPSLDPLTDARVRGFAAPTSPAAGYGSSSDGSQRVIDVDAVIN